MAICVPVEAVARAQSLYDDGFHRGAIDVLEAELLRAPDAGPLWRLRAIFLQRQERRAAGPISFLKSNRARSLSVLS